MFAAGLYPRLEYEYGIRLFHHTVPLMLMTYVGATKTWFYWILLRVFPPSAALVRIPMLLLGAVTILLLYSLLRRLGGARAALLGAALLATDPLFLLTTVSDWGPVTLFHTLLTAALLLGFLFHETGSAKALSGAFFCLGLGLWDKALFVWVLAGLGAGLVAVFPKETLRSLSARRFAIAGLAFVVGAFPLLLYNAARGNRTIGDNASFSFGDVGLKAQILWRSFNSSLLFGWMVDDSGETILPHGTLLGPALVIALLLMPLLWRTRVRRPILFGFVALAVAWLQMAITKDAGGAAHHTVLLWPLPHLIVALAFSEASRFGVEKSGLALFLIAAVAMTGVNALVARRYFEDLKINGAPTNFTDAIYPLSAYLANSPGGTVFVNDWGMHNCLRLLLRGRSTIQICDPTFKSSPDQKDKEKIRGWLETPRQAFVCHTADREFISGSCARLLAIAQDNGFAKTTAQVIRDRHNRPIFEVFRFSPR